MSALGDESIVTGSWTCQRRTSPWLVKGFCQVHCDPRCASASYLHKKQRLYSISDMMYTLQIWRLQWIPEGYYWEPSRVSMDTLAAPMDTRRILSGYHVDTFDWGYWDPFMVSTRYPLGIPLVSTNDHVSRRHHFATWHPEDTFGIPWGYCMDPLRVSILVSRKYPLLMDTLGILWGYCRDLLEYPLGIPKVSRKYPLKLQKFRMDTLGIEHGTRTQADTKTGALPVPLPAAYEM